MTRIIGLIFCALCFCSADLLAQEIVVQRWTPSEPRQRSSGTIALTVPASSDKSSVPLSCDIVPGTGQGQSAQNRMLPFPVLTPQAVIYPRRAIRKGWEGQTVVAAEVLPDGTVGRTAVAQSSGHEILDHAAQDAIKTWKFETESEIEEAVPQYVDIPVTFKLKDHGE